MRGALLQPGPDQAQVGPHRTARTALGAGHDATGQRVGDGGGIVGVLAARIDGGRVVHGGPALCGPVLVTVTGGRDRGGDRTRCALSDTGSTGSTASANTASKTASNAVMSSARFTPASAAPPNTAGAGHRYQCAHRRDAAVGPLAETTHSRGLQATSATAKAARSTPRSSAGAVTRDAVGAPPGSAAPPPARPPRRSRTSARHRHRPGRAGRSVPFGAATTRGGTAATGAAAGLGLGLVLDRGRLTLGQLGLQAVDELGRATSPTPLEHAAAELGPSLPTTLRSVSTAPGFGRFASDAVAERPWPRRCGAPRFFAAAVDQRAVRGLARSTKCALPLNSLVTGPT